MTRLSLSLSYRLPLENSAPAVLPREKTFVRVLHEVEVPEWRRNVPPKMPEVRPLFPNHHSPFGKYHQLLSWRMNPLLTAGNMTAVYHAHLWIANNQGFGMDGDPRANYFSMTNLDEELPRVEALTCGGNILSILGDITVREAGKDVPSHIVETLDWHDPAPSIEWITARPWFITEAVKLNRYGLPTRFPQGQQENGFQPGVRHPLIADPSRYDGIEEPFITIPKWRVILWEEELPPDPYKVYL